MKKKQNAFLRFCTSPETIRAHTNPILYKEKWSISVDGTKLTHMEQKKLHLKIYGRRTLAYWNKKDSTPMDPGKIDWKLSRQVMRKEPKGRRRIDIKLLCDQFGLNKTLYNRQQ